MLIISQLSADSTTNWDNQGVKVILPYFPRKKQPQKTFQFQQLLFTRKLCFAWLSKVLHALNWKGISWPDWA